MERPDLKSGLEQLAAELARRGLTLKQAREAFERQLIVSTIRRHRGSLSRSAHSLGIHRNTLRNKMLRLDIEAADWSTDHSGAP